MTFILEQDPFLGISWGILAIVLVAAYFCVFTVYRDSDSYGVGPYAWSFIVALLGLIVFLLLFMVAHDKDADARLEAVTKAITSDSQYVAVDELPDELDTYIGVREDGTAQKFFLRETGQPNTYQVVELDN